MHHLAEALGKNARSDREKVDRIFSWVIHHISYDYKVYFSGKGISQNDPSDVLRSRSGVCGDFSTLLDTLFQLNGLESQIITGYAKEVFFNPGDPLYFSNHVWNAVKIDRLWYLCDPTYCSSMYEFAYTKRALKRLTRIRRLSSKVKVRSRRIRTVKDADCFQAESQNRLKTDTLLRIVPRIRIFFLELLPFKVKVIQSKTANLDYYLTDPAVFSIDHFPDDPIWSLQTKYDSIEHFSKDSLYYFRSLHRAEYQNKKGVFCLDCDRLTQLSSRESIVHKMIQSKRNNANNNFLQAECQAQLMQYTFRDFLNEEDSLAKMKLMDSVLYQIKLAQSLYKAAKVNANNHRRFQSRKNRWKKKLATKEFYWMNKQMRLTQNAFHKEFLKSKSLVKKVSAERKRIPKQRRAYQKAENKHYTKQFISEERGLKLVQMLQNFERELDSLNGVKQAYEQKITEAVDSLNDKISLASSFMIPINQALRMDRRYRLIGQKDNLDLEMDTLEAQTRNWIQGYQWTMDSLIINPSKNVYFDFKQASYTERKRMRMGVKIIKLTKKMMMYGLYSKESFQELTTTLYQQMETSKCWLARLRLPTKELSRRLWALRRLERTFNLNLSRCNSAEKYRFKRIEKLVKNSSDRVHNASEHNIRLLNRIKRKVYREKERYIKRFK